VTYYTENTLLLFLKNYGKMELMLNRIKEIEGGSEQSSFDIENIDNPIESISRAYQMAKSAKKEIMMLYPTLNSFSVSQKKTLQDDW
jgi:hypothetical protein